ncbi:CitMHS family transporter [Halotalea alkalilenta]|uniref:Citrate transporter n=1 Tax=Halotalea alkalilenta TaxID=376489 RepID=A0A172YCQ6_9GAMM|nr:citrate:proton symporter [Halotalea alkalilenta]ANF56994.1 citrate transporter [Halotalea alkalilenta]
MLTIIGLIVIVAIVVTLITEKLSPLVALTAIPFAGALAAGYSLSEISDFFQSGVTRVANVAFMFMFAILFFSIMKERGLFDPIVRGVIKLTRGNVIAVAVMTTLLAGIVHLDGSGAATFLIVIPALLPLYQRLGMRPLLLLLLMSMSMGVMNMVPWGGPIGRAGAVTGVDPTELWHALIPVQLCGMIGALALAALFGWREQRLIRAQHGEQSSHQAMTMPLQSTVAAHAASEPRRLPEFKRMQRRVQAQFGDDEEQSIPEAGLPRHFWINLAIVITVVAVLAMGWLAPAYTFMLALGAAFAVNLPRPADQAVAIKKHAPQALNMAAIIGAAGAFLGILSDGGMLTSIANDLANTLPRESIAWLHVVVGIFGVPLDMLTSTDAYYFALLPVVQEVTAPAGVDPRSVVYAMAIGNNAGTFVSPFAPAVWLAVGLAGVQMGQHLRFSFPIIWLFSLYLLGLGALFGLF